jgi:tetratricopeptide (TPR) repeat protein
MRPMNKKIQTLILAAAACVMVSCSSTQVALHTTPSQSRVYAKSLGRGKTEFIGETPLFIKGDQLEKEFGGSGPIYLEFRKEGYRTASTIVTELSFIDLNLTMEMTPESGMEDPSIVNALIDTMFESQRLVRVKRYDEALNLLGEVKKKAPQVSAIYELEGGIYYLQQKYQDALDSYRLAVKYNPRNAEALRMKNSIEDSFGIRRQSKPKDSPEAVAPTLVEPSKSGGQ